MIIKKRTYIPSSQRVKKIHCFALMMSVALLINLLSMASVYATRKVSRLRITSTNMARTHSLYQRHWLVSFQPDLGKIKDTAASTKCRQLTPANFFGDLKNEVSKGILTSNGVKLSKLKFQENLKHGLYIVSGHANVSRLSTPKLKGEIFFHALKTAEMGKTEGAWSLYTNNKYICNGFYTGLSVQR